MSKMKKGTNVGLDKNYDNVRVGDTIVAKDGVEYAINSYGMAVGPDGKSKKLSEVKDFEVRKQPGQPAAEAAQELTEELLPGTDLKALDEFDDNELVAELRRRGWTVACTKKVEKVVLKTVKL